MNITQELYARRRVLNEIWDARQRQTRDHGYTPRHDDEQHVPGVLSRAAAAYALAGSDLQLGVAPDAVINARAAVAYGWPFSDPASWRPESERDALVKAGALIVAALQQMDRRDTPAPETDDD